MAHSRLLNAWLFFGVLIITSLECADHTEVTAQDFLKASTVEDLTSKNPDFKKNPSFEHFVVLEGHKKIIKAILTEDLQTLTGLFSKDVHIEIGEVYYKKFKITKEELANFLMKKSILYKFIFNHELAMKAMPTVHQASLKFHSVKYCLENGTLYFVSKALLDFPLRGKNRDGVSIRTECIQEKCRIIGFVNNGYGAGLDK